MMIIFLFFAVLSSLKIIELHIDKADYVRNVEVVAAANAVGFPFCLISKPLIHHLSHKSLS